MTKIPRDISLDGQLEQLAKLTNTSQTDTAILFGIKKTIDEIMMAYIDADLDIKSTERKVRFVNELKRWRQHKNVSVKQKLWAKNCGLHSQVIKEAAFVITLESVYNTIEDARLLIQYVKRATSIVVDEQRMIDMMLDDLGL